MKQVMTKFASFKIDNGGDTLMSSDASYYHAMNRILNIIGTIIHMLF